LFAPLPEFLTAADEDAVDGFDSFGGAVGVESGEAEDGLASAGFEPELSPSDEDGEGSLTAVLALPPSRLSVL
jgi:hypothetical protein